MMLMQCFSKRLHSVTPRVLQWSPYIPLDLVVKVVCRGSLLLVDAFDVSLGGTCYEAFSRGVMASPARVRARG